MTAHFLNHRQIDRRILVESLLELASPCHLGGTDANASSDRPLLRDGNGQPYLPSTTLTGLLRAALERTESSEAVGALFGANWRDPQGKQARLLISNALIEHAGFTPTELCDGVRIDPCRGVAEDQKKFDLELLPKSTRFRLCFEIDLFGKEDKDRILLRGFVKILQALEQGGIALGARTRRGFGETRMVSDSRGYRWHVEEYPVATQGGLFAWLGRGLTQPPEGWPPVKSIPYKDVSALAQQWKIALPDHEALTDWMIALALELRGSLLVGSEGHDPEEPDRSHLQRLSWKDGQVSMEPLLPATSLAGVLRHRCLRIAFTLAGQGNKKARKLVEDMFGPEKIGKNERGWASRVTIREACVHNGRSLRHTRLRIDPWTGGAVESLLFTEDAWYGGEVEIEIKLREASDTTKVGPASRALLLLALRDLASGNLSVGAESGVGRGRLSPIPGRPFAIGSEPRVELYLKADGSVRCDPPDAFAAEFEALHLYLGGGATE